MTRYFAIIIASLLLFSSVQAATVTNYGDVSIDIGVSYSNTHSFDEKSIFKDYYNIIVNQTLPLQLSVEHDGMWFKRILLFDKDDLGGDSLRRITFLGESFESEIMMVDAGSYRLKFAGIASKDSYYNLTITAVPIPAAALLFASALFGVAAYSRKRRVTMTA